MHHPRPPRAHAYIIAPAAAANKLDLAPQIPFPASPSPPVENLGTQPAVRRARAGTQPAVRRTLGATRRHARATGYRRLGQFVTFCHIGNQPRD